MISGGNEKIPAPVVEYIANPEDRIAVRIVSLWGIAIKIKIGKLTLPKPFDAIEQNMLVKIMALKFCRWGLKR